MFGRINDNQRIQIREQLMKALRLLENPSIPEILAASYISKQLLFIQGLSYQRLYYELYWLADRGRICKISAKAGHLLRFTIDPNSFNRIEKTLYPIPSIAVCESCGATCVSYRLTMYSIQSNRKCDKCDDSNGELKILIDNAYYRKFIIHNNAFLGVLDYYSIRLPGSIRGYGTEYLRAFELLNKLTGNTNVLAVVGLLN